MSFASWWEDYKLGWARISREAAAAADVPLTDTLSKLAAYATNPQGFVDDLAAGAVPAKVVNDIAQYALDAQTENDRLYWTLEAAREAGTGGDLYAEAKAKQEEGWRNIQACNYALYAVPTFAAALRAKLVRPAKAQYATAAPGFFGDLARQVNAELKKAGAPTELAGLGQTAALVGIAIAIIVVASFRQIAMFYIAESAAARKYALDKTFEVKKACIDTGSCTPELLDALENPPEPDLIPGLPDTVKGLGSILMWAAIIGAGLIFLPTLISAGKAGKEAIDARRARGFAQPQLPAPALQGRRRRY